MVEVSGCGFGSVPVACSQYFFLLSASVIRGSQILKLVSSSCLNPREEEEESLSAAIVSEREWRSEARKRA